MNALIDQDTLQKLRPPIPAEAATIVAVDRNKWFVVALILSLIIILMFFYITSLVGKATANTQVIWVKMFSDGHSEVETSAPSDIQQFYRANIDKNIADYVSYRWNQRPTTIREDYGRALLFMGRELGGSFTNPQGFYAADKAAKISSAIDSDSITYHVDLIDHYDKKATYTAATKTKGELYRTNIYVTKSVNGAHGENKAKPESFILQLDWRLATKDELKDKNKDYFLVNSVGLVIEEEAMNLAPKTSTAPEPTPTTN